MRGVKGVKAIALDVDAVAETISAFRDIMMDRFKFMEEQQVNNIKKIKDVEVDYYTIQGQDLQFDEIVEVLVDLRESDFKDQRQFRKLRELYPDGRLPRIVTVENLYKKIEDGSFANPQLPERKGYNSYIQLSDFTITKKPFIVKTMLFLVDEFNFNRLAIQKCVEQLTY